MKLIKHLSCTIHAPFVELLQAKEVSAPVEAVDPDIVIDEEV